MFYKKAGLPRESEIVLCTVSKLTYHSVFVNLNDYPNKTAMLHISEVSPGRIRNIRDYVKEGKVIVCKVLKMDEKRNHIDVSLRRVSESQRRLKIDLMKQEQKSEKIIEFIAKDLKQEPEKLYSKLFKLISKDYDYLHEAFNDVIINEFDLSILGLPEKTSTLLEEVIRQRIKPPEVYIKAKLHIECYEKSGVIVIRDLLNSLIEIDPEKVSIKYLGGGSYAISMFAEIYDEIQPYYDTIVSNLKTAESKNFIYTLEKA